MKRLTLSQRFALVFASLLLLCTLLSGWMQIRINAQYGSAVVQRLSAGLASHIASLNPNMIGEQGVNVPLMKALFKDLMVLNPSVEVYLLDIHGNILADAAPPNHIKRTKVDVAPLLIQLKGETAPVYGDDPRNLSEQKVFSVALLSFHGQKVGYLYVILQGENYHQLAQAAQIDILMRTSFWSSLLVALFGLTVGAVAFSLITRPIRQLTQRVRQLNQEDITAIKQLAELPLPQAQEKDEVSLLQGAFIGMARRVAFQWEKLTYQDQLRRDFVANISHDLRTPLTTLHGYLETLLYKSDSLKSEESQRYLHIALSQSQKVSMLAQQLFELAQLEYGVIKPNREVFSLSELTHDVVQKFELMASTRNIRFVVDIPDQLPQVNADVSMIDRVLTNLLDNALKHTPEMGTIIIALRSTEGEVEVILKDTGPGIPEALRATLFERPSALTHASTRKNSGGLGLMVVRRILQLHGRDIRLDEKSAGACFRFAVPR